MTLPIDAIIAVTYRCNSQCKMCDVWKQKLGDVLMPEHLAKLPASLKTVNLTGGEPFLRDDLPEFVQAIRNRCPEVQITISSNAILGKKIFETMKEIRRIDPTIRLALSLDGIDFVHDRIRGREGVFVKVIKLIDDLQSDHFPGLRLSMTISDYNLEQLRPVADLAERHELELGVVAAHDASVHMGTGHELHALISRDVRHDFEVIIGRWLRCGVSKKWLRGHFLYNTYRYLLGKRWKNDSRAGEDMFFLRPDGEMFGSSMHGQSMGNLIEQDWDELWTGPQAEAARKTARETPDTSWMICTARRYYRRHAVGVVLWVMWHKLLAHLRLLRVPKGGAACADSANR